MIDGIREEILGLALLGMIMTGAIFSLLRYREPISHLAAALGIATLLALDAIALSAGTFFGPVALKYVMRIEAGTQHR